MQSISRAKVTCDLWIDGISKDSKLQRQFWTYLIAESRLGSLYKLHPKVAKLNVSFRFICDSAKAVHMCLHVTVEGAPNNYIIISIILHCWHAKLCQDLFSMNFSTYESGCHIQINDWPDNSGFRGTWIMSSQFWHKNPLPWTLCWLSWNSKVPDHRAYY